MVIKMVTKAQVREMEEIQKGYEYAESILHEFLWSIEGYTKPSYFVDNTMIKDWYKSNKIVQDKFAKISKDLAKAVQDVNEARTYFREMDYQFRKKRDALIKQYYREHGTY